MNPDSNYSMESPPSDSPVDNRTTARKILDTISGWGAPDRSDQIKRIDRIRDRKLSRCMLRDWNRPRGKHQLNRVYDPETGKLLGYRGITKELGQPTPIYGQMVLVEMIPNSYRKNKYYVN